MSQTHWDLVVKAAAAIWPVIGALVGVVIGALLTRSWDRKKWLNDNRKQEYRELLTSLTSACSVMIDNFHAKGANLQTEAQRDATKEEYFKSLRILKDRIFIAQEVEQMNLFDRWGDATKGLVERNDLHEFEDTFEKMKKDIVNMATKVN